MGATGYIPKSLEVVNAVLDNLGIDQLPENTVIEDILPGLPQEQEMEWLLMI